MPTVKTVCLDPAAHWPDNIGLGGYSERNSAWDIANACRALLEHSYSDKCRAVMTRANKGDLQQRYPGYLNEEVRRINASGADYSLSIHTDASSNPSARGVTCFKGGPLSEAFGNKLLAAIAARFTDAELPLRRATAIDHYNGRNYLAVMRRTTMPTALIECGFHSNEQDMALLSTPDGRERIGRALADGIADHFGWEAGVPPEDLRVALLPGGTTIACRPQIEGGVTRVDLRALAEALGCQVIADDIDTERIIYLRKGGDISD